MLQYNKNHSSTWQTFRRLWPIIFPFRVGLVVASITLILNATSDALMLALLKPLLDDGFGKANRDVFMWMPLALVGLMGIRGFSGFASTYCISWVSGKVVMQMRRALFKHIMNMPVSFFVKQSTGTLVSRITYDSDQVASSSSGALVTVIREGASIIGLCVMMFYYSWQLSLILVLIAPIVSITIKLVSHRFRTISKKMQSAMGQLTSSAEQMLQGHKEVLIFGGQHTEKDRFNCVSNRMRQQSMKMVQTSSIFDPLIQCVASLALAFVLYVASIPSVMEMLTAGTITVIFSSMIVLMKPLKSLTNVSAQFQRGMAACQTLFSILDLETEKDQGILDITRVQGHIIFDDVTFFYPEKSTPSLSKINFSIEAGKTVALVGRSGSGKSTIVNLLTRFYDIDKGRILLDGFNLNDYKLSSLRNQIAMVSQNVHLFNDTIANNIAYARRNFYSRESIETAARMACAMDFISQMKNGLDTIIGENGILLSSGQRQRIAIARALLRDCPILIFDEATSALDSASEHIIHRSLDTLKKNRTSLIIAHRLSTVENADEILVIENGYIMERGVHKVLIRRQGIYAQLYKLQFSS
ncbi:lipid A ABC transporter ATP-binding protein/permease MsbA [Blochmannia endosymbiont of Camponotus modoc]|uniref:lipid A ABC transporter ATP-binding protein/permease MsbA n=1 Tax=Blochmannia endosymbiont of Camponotus modoc TaxID=2945587 RepID=UPI002024D859|nr:lipid A ABC transporter ATP-binding protein/permease MsbA [Blochmannia endosymbiont of Camponotus modoc]URJ26405.1 lipid A ABC transporter ATP-binding protein/permease MsbA [Blochmannia endosymbiont of Camponotus modoc]URJ31556.1 lipid A ABC transporter ATP-binding protein/permease MsbA [Blochmannia endosymbiont of Camponotus modoc]